MPSQPHMRATSALYYPHTKIEDKNLIKNSLLLWDQVEYIVPSPHWHHVRFESKVYNEAIDLIARPHYPTQAEREELHQKAEALVNEGLPEWFYLDAMRNIRNPPLYDIYPDKLSEKTWRLFRDNFLVRYNQISSDYSASGYFGLVLMSLLADSIAGEKKRKITDRSEAYAWLQQYATSRVDGQYVNHLDVTQIAPDYNRLVTLSIKVLDTDDISVKSLVAMRKREIKSSSSADYRKFRHNYLKKLDQYINEISKLHRKSDINEVERQFKQDMTDDLKDLRQELNLTKTQLGFSKEVAIAAVAAVGALTSPIIGLTDVAKYFGTLGVGALIGAAAKHKMEMKKVLRSNAMSWMYLAKKRNERLDLKKAIF
ncbi:MAG: hypothetical protein E6Q24_21265 [Chitinophagaceae bacterium]|nr:MAG: hypothetical protein E6Q24_21265 [Chitinophagaceae bacterium]